MRPAPPPALRPVHRGRSARRFTPRNEAADTRALLEHSSDLSTIWQPIQTKSLPIHYNSIFGTRSAVPPSNSEPMRLNKKPKSSDPYVAVAKNP
ncbi:hypothetical protein, partial [Burkholderia pseudomallei]|uniref:hypothetical protein n=1 Tax=Burkholderia pseudomallei TaxID=28450 RepID=UPI001CA4E8F1